MRTGFSLTFCARRWFDRLKCLESTAYNFPINFMGRTFPKTKKLLNFSKISLLWSFLKLGPRVPKWGKSKILCILDDRPKCKGFSISNYRKNSCHFGTRGPNFKKLHRSESLMKFNNFFVFGKFYPWSLWENYKRLIPGILNGFKSPPCTKSDANYWEPCAHLPADGDWCTFG